MAFLLNKTQTLTGSWISNIFKYITQIKPKYKFLFLFIICYLILGTSKAEAVTNPLSVANNKVGIHLINPTNSEADEAADLVNSSGGGWGYVTVTIRSDDKDFDKWQNFFNELRKKHLIPLLRLATTPQGDFWKTADSNQVGSWANFLDSLNWPTRNRYVIIYNEPNHAQEWGNNVDAKSYARILDQFITTLKNKNGDFFVLNAGLDSSAPQKLPAYEDEINFLAEMNQEVPGIFNKLDGWVSHSYPNPDYSGSPNASGRGSIRNYQWELSVLNGLGLTKDLPIFITETGWKHSEGLKVDNSYPNSETVGQYLKQAFQEAWNDPKIVAVTPFLLDYQDSPFDHFSFKRPAESGIGTVLGASNDLSIQFYPQYISLAQLNKTPGQPIQLESGLLIEGEVYKSIVSGQSYDIPLTFKNTGQAIWGEKGPIKLVILRGGQPLDARIDESNSTIEPGQKLTYHLKVKSPQVGAYNVSLALYDGPVKVDTQPLDFTTEVKSPVVLVVKASLAWKKNLSGDYLLSVLSAVGESTRHIILGDKGISEEIEARDLLPDYQFYFTLKKPFYKPKTINQRLVSGINTLDFGELQPDIGSAILHPADLWKLLPFSN